MTAVEVAGVGIHPFGRFEGVTTTDMGVVAVRAALAEAGIGKGDFQAAFCGTAYGGVASGHKVLGALGLTGMPIVDVEAGCASGSAALMLASSAVATGQYDTVLVFGIEKMPKGIIRSSFFEPWQEESGMAATPAYFALRAQRLMITSGVTKEHLAAVVVKNRRHGVGNPDAMFRSEVEATAVLASRVVSEPLHLWMLCTPNEGAAAVVLTRQKAGSGRGVPVRMAAATLRSHIAGAVLSESTPLSGLTDDTIMSATSLAATAAYEEAGIGPHDLDVVECQDTDAARELLSYEELGLCRAGGLGRHARSRGDEPRWAPARQRERRPFVEGRAPGRFRTRSGGGAGAPAPGRSRRATGLRGAGGAGPYRGPGCQRRRGDRDPLVRCGPSALSF